MKEKKAKFTKHPYYTNRELSWLKFNERVLDEAADMSVPLCERMTFLSIFQSNLDEFFMVRVGSLYDQMIVAKEERDNKTGMTSKEQIAAVFAEVKSLDKKKDGIYKKVMQELKREGIAIVSFSSVKKDDAAYLEQYFRSSILPLLSPQIVGKKQPFPFLQNKEIYAVVELAGKGSDKLGLVPCSRGVFKRLIPVPSDKMKYMLVEDLILHFMPLVFENYMVKSKSLIRIVRNADIDVDEAYFDEDLDYRGMMEHLISRRKKLCPVKLEYSRVLNKSVILSLCKELKMKEDYLFYSEAPLDMSFFFAMQDIMRERKELFYERRVPQKSVNINHDAPMMYQAAKKDILLFYPYERMNPFIRLLQEAGRDERVLSIKMTLYRVAKNSQIVEALIEAAENGKEVVVLVELRARFDEENNIEWSRRLEDAGCRIIYGIDHIKVHSKLCLITYQEGEAIRYLTQIGTGNYNEKTSKLYTDLSLITGNQEIGAEAVEVFQALCMAQVMEETHHLLVAPKCLQNKVLAMMDDEIALAKEGKPAYIGVKVNSLTDKVIMDKLIEASKSGVRIEMVVRGICCLIPGIKGYTDNIHVISIVGRYLEHSRIYIFGTPERDRIYISSADYMTRNTTRRVEVAAPILDPDIKERIRTIFHTLLADNVKARVLKADGTYEMQRNEKEPLNAQEYFYELMQKKIGSEEAAE